MSDMTAGAPMDRRVKRTQSAIISAFDRLILERGYASLTPGDVAAAADVGRSTFYKHFHGIDDLLETTLDGVLGPLARECFEVSPTAEALRVVEHIWENRRLAHILLNGGAQARVLQSLTRQFKLALKGASQTPDGPKPLLALDLIALQLANGQITLLGAWISGRSGHSAQKITAALHASGRASALALIGAA